MFRIALRRSISLLKKLHISLSSKLKTAYCRSIQPELSLPFNAVIKKGVVISVTDGGVISVGQRVKFGRDAHIIARGGTLSIGDHVEIGRGAVITCMNNVEIGNDTLIAEYVVIRDQDHDYLSRPVRNAGFVTGPISIGADCWLGSKATVLRNSTIGEGAVIGAHALVKGAVPPYGLAVGVPAKTIKILPHSRSSV